MENRESINLVDRLLLLRHDRDRLGVVGMVVACHERKDDARDGEHDLEASQNDKSRPPEPVAMLSQIGTVSAVDQVHVALGIPRE